MNHNGHCENGHSFGQMKFGFQGMPIIHPHSLPDYHDGLTNGIPYSSLNTVPAMAININSGPGEGINHQYIQKVGCGSLDSHLFEGGSMQNPLALNYSFSYCHVFFGSLICIWCSVG